MTEFLYEKSIFIDIMLIDEHQINEKAGKIDLNVVKICCAPIFELLLNSIFIKYQKGKIF